MIQHASDGPAHPNITTEATTGWATRRASGAASGGATMGATGRASGTDSDGATMGATRRASGADSVGSTMGATGRASGPASGRVSRVKAGGTTRSVEGSADSTPTPEVTGQKARKRAFLLSCILLLCFTLFPGGKLFSQSGYFVRDSMMQAGVKPVDQGARKNAREMIIDYKTRTERFTPEEISEYGFPDGRVFLSRVISVDGRPQRVFLERIGNGKLDLWYFAGSDGDRFFLERPGEGPIKVRSSGLPAGQQPESSLIELPEADGLEGPFRSLLATYTSDCDQVAEALKVVRFNKKSLTAFLSRYNTCSSRPMPIARFGVTTGGSFTQVGHLRPELEGMARMGFNHDPALVAGLFADLPVFADGITFHPEILYFENSWSVHSENQIATFDFLISTASLQVPLLVRYTLPTLRWRPFVNLGGTLTRHVRHDNTIYRTTVNDGLATITMTTGSALTARDMAGYAVGGGMQYALDHRHSLFLEIRHNSSYPLPGNRMRLSALSFYFSFNL